MAPVAFVDEHIAEPREGRTVRDDAREADGRARRIVDRDRHNAIPQRLCDDLAADVSRPVGAREDAVDRVEVLTRGIEGDRDVHG